MTIETDLYDISGIDHTKTIMLIHGIRLTRKMWFSQINYLSQYFRIVAPDLPGHGANSSLAFSLTESIDILKKIIDESSLGKVLMVGISLGGYIVQRFVSDFPEYTCGIVLSGCTKILKGWKFVLFKIALRAYNIFGSDFLKILDTKLFWKHYPPEISERIISAGFYYKAIGEMLKELSRKEFLIPLSEYDKPILIVNGKKDFIFRGDEKLYLTRLPKARLRIIDNAGHLCNLDNPSAFNTAIKGFAHILNWN